MANGFSIMKNRSLLTIGVAESVSNIGNWVTMMAVFTMVVFKGEGGVLQSSGIFLAGLLPVLLFSPVAGWLSDRFDRKWLMIASEVLAGVTISGLIFVTRLEWIYALIALQALFTSWMQPARQAVIPSIVSGEDLPRANAFLQQLNGIIKIFAPVVAGFVLTLMNPHQAILLDVISFAFSALILSRLPAMRPTGHAVRRDDTPVPAQASGSVLNIVGRLPQLKLLFASMFLAITVIVGFDILSSIFTRDVLSGNEKTFGFMISLVGVGTLIATVWIVLRKNSNSWHDLILGVALLSLIPFSLAQAASSPGTSLALALTMAGCLVGGLGNGMVVVQSATLMQILTPPAYLGRMGGIFQSTAVAGQLAGMLLTPLLVPNILSLGHYFVLSGLLLALLAGYTLLKLRRAAPAANLPTTGQD